MYSHRCIASRCFVARVSQTQPRRIGFYRSAGKSPPIALHVQSIKVTRRCNEARRLLHTKFPPVNRRENTLQTMFGAHEMCLFHCGDDVDVDVVVVVFRRENCTNNQRRRQKNTKPTSTLCRLSTNARRACLSEQVCRLCVRV